MTRFGKSQSVLRLEDDRLLRGAGCFLDDVPVASPLHAVMVRSPHGHAEVRGIETGPAHALPGVVAVLTADDVDTAGVGDQPCLIPLENRDGSSRADPGHPVLARDRVRHVGDPVAMVVGETPEAARDGADAVMVDYAPLPAAGNIDRALASDTPQVWPEAPGNLAFDWETGDKAATKAAFDEAAHVVSLTLANNRVAINPIEPRGAIGAWDETRKRYTLWVSSQGVHLLHQMLCDMMALPPDDLRVITPDVGGGFGMKIYMYSEYPLVLLAARRLGRPVKWMGERADSFLSDTHGRDTVTDGALALDAEGRFLALRMRTDANMGAYLSTFAPMIPTAAGTRPLPGVYRFNTAHVAVRGVFTNTTPVDAYRGAGRPETMFVLERLVDEAAHQLGIAPDELRRRNFVAPDEMPWQLALGQTIDSGEFNATMQEAMRLADWPGFPARAQAASNKGIRPGIGMAYYMEVCGGGDDEAAELRFPQPGIVELVVGTQSNGQGHATAYSQIVASVLGLPLESVRFVEGDTDTVPSGRGTGGSRSLPVCGSAVLRAAEGVVDKGVPLAAEALEVSQEDIEYDASQQKFRVVGTDRAIGLFDLAERLGDSDTPLDTRIDHLPDGQTVPNGCHICEVEVSPETGTITIVRYTVVDDFGVLLNPPLAAGQVHGGVAQGIGQALLEASVVEPESAQLLSGSFMDYALPRADHFSPMTVAFNEVPCRNNPLGIKGAGEAGAVGAPAALVNAVANALRPLGVDVPDMPLTPLRVWQQLRATPHG